ncbi:hypothetical protein HK104_000340 [Borealophlyctis nickersoniae]|nr:hypothetical protein HK104_000340 [Borealophlyctis nickersoniae]
MEVLKNNFETMLGIMADAIKEADIVAVDTELTGIQTDPTLFNKLIDTPQQRYTKIKTSASTHLVTQYGICCFRWDADTETYIAKPFNVYIFPQTGQRLFNLDRSFLSQTSSLEFLMKNKFDFNKWISQGVPYMTLDEEEEARLRIGSYHMGSEIMIDDTNREFVETSLSIIDTWLQNSPDKTITITTPSSYHKRLIHQEVKKRYNATLGTDGKSGQVEVSKLTVEERGAKVDEKEGALLEELSQLIGFRRVMEAISESGKPVIGHNMYLDLCHTYHHFHRRLPNELEDFKKGLHQLFPKYVAELHRDFAGYDSDEGSFHEAGYDAYATGVAFLRMAAIATGGDGQKPIDFGHSVFRDTINKLYLMRSDLLFMNVNGPDDAPDRDHFFHIEGFPGGTPNPDLHDEFRPYYGQVSIHWIDASSCFIEVKDKEKAKLLAKSLSRDSKAKSVSGSKFKYRMQTWAAHKQSLAGAAGGLETNGNDFVANGDRTSTFVTPKKRPRESLDTTPSTDSTPPTSTDSTPPDISDGEDGDVDGEGGTPKKRRVAGDCVVA